MNRSEALSVLQKFKFVVVCNDPFTKEIIRSQLEWIYVMPGSYKVIKHGAIGDDQPVWSDLERTLGSIYIDGKKPIIIIGDIFGDETEEELLKNVVDNFKEGGVVAYNTRIDLEEVEKIENTWKSIKNPEKEKWLFTMIDTPNELVYECQRYIGKESEYLNR